MSEHPFPTPDEAPEATPEPVKPAKVVDPHAGFCVYDDTLTRYVGSVHPSKSAAEKAHPGKVKGHSYTTRAV